MLKSCQQFKKSRFQDHFLKAVVDGKQKVLNNRWGVLTLGFIIRRQSLSTTSKRLAAGARKQLKAYTSTMQPLFQAVIDTESEENLKAFFEDAVTLCRNSSIDLKRWLIQVHKDYAKGIEAARSHVFPSVRSVEDYFHMLQCVMNTLHTKLTKQKTKPEARWSPSSTEPWRSRLNPAVPG